MKRKHQQLKVQEIPIPPGAKHPPLPKGDGILPGHEFTMGIIAPKGSGKTTTIANLLMFYKGYFNSIYVFSPTINSDEKWDFIKRQKLLSKNTRLEKWMEKMRKKAKDKDAVVKPINPAAEIEQFIPKQDKEFDGTIPDENYFHEYNEKVLMEIIQDQKALVDILKSHGETKHTAHRILIVLDDMVGSDLFSNRRDNFFKMLNANHRHSSLSMIMVTQAYNEIPRTVRTQFSSCIIFEIPNEKEVEVVYKEQPVGMKMKDWLEVYDYCTADDYSFMFINYQKPKRLRVMKKFDQYVFIEKE